MAHSKIIAALAAPLLLAMTASEGPDREGRLVEEFEAICLQTNGDAEIAGEVARARGYVTANQTIPDNLFRSDRLTVYEKVDSGMQFRATTRPSSMSSAWEGAVAQNRCHVAVSAGDRGRLRSILTQRLNVRSFRQGDAAVFAWITAAGGTRQAVSRAAFENSFVRMMETQNLRFVTAARQDDLLILGYFARNPLEVCRRFASHRECYAAQ